MKQFKIVWSGKAVGSLHNIKSFIQKDSPQAAQKVAQSIVDLAQTLKTFPTRFAIEPLLADETVVYRFVSKWNYKLIYVVEENEVLIVEIFDTRQSTDKLKI